MDLKKYSEILDNNSSEFIELINSCNLGELNFKETNVWNVLEIAEHVFLTDRLVLSLISWASERKAESEELIGFDKLNKILVQLRGRKVSAPEIVHPKGNIRSAADFERMFLDQRNLLKANIVSGKIIVDNRIYAHPFLGEMTIRDWFYFIPNHAQRHLEQMKDLLSLIRSKE
jgi:hypothetical protein